MIRRLLRRSFVTAAAAAAVAAAFALTGCDDSPGTAPPPPEVPLSSLQIAPTRDTLAVGETLTFTVTALDTSGAPVNPGVRWSSSDVGVARVSSAGVLEAEGIGEATIVAQSGGRSDTAYVVVTPGPGWVLLPSGVSDRLEGVHVLGAGRIGWVVGAAGLILRTTDGGYSWSQQRPTTFDLNGVSSDGDEVVAVGDGGTVLKALASGGLWSRPVSFTSDNLYDVHFGTADSGWAVGAAGTVIRTVDGGDTWQRQTPTRTLNTLRSVHFADGRNGWAVGDAGTIIGTHDGGATWFAVTPTLTGEDLRAVSMSSPGAAIAVGALGAVVRTEAGPDSAEWVLDVASIQYDLEGVSSPPAGVPHVFAVGFDAGGLVIHSDDGGDSWTRQTIASTTRLRDVFFLDGRRGWTVGDNGRVFVTGTGGE